MKKSRPTVLTKEKNPLNCAFSDCRKLFKLYFLFLVPLSSPEICPPQIIPLLASTCLLPSSFGQTSHFSHQKFTKHIFYSFYANSLFKVTWVNIWLPSHAFKMNAVSGNFNILKVYEGKK
jgi:hypothetical protein